QKAPTWSPASLVAIRANVSQAASRRPLRLRSFATAQEVARARWRRCFAFSLALRLLARIVVLDLAVFFTWGSKLDGIGAIASPPVVLSAKGWTRELCASSSANWSWDRG